MAFVWLLRYWNDEIKEIYVHVSINVGFQVITELTSHVDKRFQIRKTYDQIATMNITVNDKKKV